MNAREAIDEACKEPTLVDALSWIAIWETERVIPSAHEYLSGNRPRGANGHGWDTCFKYLFKEVMEQYTVKKLKGE